MNNIAVRLAPADVVERDGEPRILDVRLGERLGMARSDKIRELIRRRQSTLERVGTLACDTPKSTGGRPGQRYWLNQTQAVLVCMWSDAPFAEDVQIEVAQVFVAWREGRLPLPDAAPAATRVLICEAIAPILAEFVPTIQDNTAAVSNCVQAIQGLQRDLQEPESRVAEADRQLLLKVAWLEYHGWCCCGCKRRIFDAQGNRLPEAVIEHFYGRQSEHIRNLWVTHCDCNERFKNPDERDKARDAFDRFRGHVEYHRFPLIAPANDVGLPAQAAFVPPVIAEPQPDPPPLGTQGLLFVDLPVEKKPRRP